MAKDIIQQATDHFLLVVCSNNIASAKVSGECSDSPYQCRCIFGLGSKVSGSTRHRPSHWSHSSICQVARCL